MNRLHNQICLQVVDGQNLSQFVFENVLTFVQSFNL